MSNDKKMTPSDSRPDPMQPLPVAKLKFSEPIDLEKKSSSSGLNTELHVNKASWRVTYLPWMRHFMVEFTEIVGRNFETIEFVHESKVKCWKLADRAQADREYQAWLAERAKLQAEAAA